MGRIRYAHRLLKEFFLFARRHKMYWIVPLILVLGLMTFLIFVSQAAAPFIYTLF
ncbi:MAG: hypothetical protein HY509_03475 [Acidobacteria bacterium]|nr:hypothetical protein [Acidobacteriota bacterium]